MIPADETESAALVCFVRSLCAARSVDELGRVFLAGFRRVVDAPMYGFNLVDRETDDLQYNAAANVSDVFVARYTHDVMQADPLRAQALSRRRAAYNLDLMTEEQWLACDAYRGAYAIHSMRHVVEAPILGVGGVIGGLHFARSAPAHAVVPHELAMAQALADVLGHAIADMRSRERVERERDHALQAFDLTGTALVISNPRMPELRLSAAARRILADVHEGEGHLHRVLARPPTDGNFSRRTEVELASGERGMLHAHSSPMADGDEALVSVLELQREQPGISPGRMAALTPREADVAKLTVDGLSDREIAERLCLSHHTVGQHLKRIYRKLEVDSRVALTRLLLGVPRTVRHT